MSSFQSQLSLDNQWWYGHQITKIRLDVLGNTLNYFSFTGWKTFKVYLQLRLLRHTYLGPLGIELTSFDSIVQRRPVLSQFEKRRRTVAVQDTVLWVSLQGIRVQMDGRLKVTALARLVALLHFLHELCFAETTPAASVSRDTADGSARRPRTEDWKLEKGKRGVKEL